MKKYIGTKIIEAQPGTMAEAQALKSNFPIELQKNPGGPQGFIVKYPDGYISWSPKEVFEAAYRECDNMPFGLALEALKKGKKVARRGWNGKGMFLFIQDGSRVNTKDLRAELMKEYCKSRAIQHVKINPHIDMKAEDGSHVVGWLASQADLFAEDWIIVE